MCRCGAAISTFVLFHDNIPLVSVKVLATGSSSSIPTIATSAWFIRVGASVQNDLRSICDVVKARKSFSLKVLIVQVSHNTLAAVFSDGAALTSLHHQMAPLYAQLTRPQLPGPGPWTGCPPTPRR